MSAGATRKRPGTTRSTHEESPQAMIRVGLEPSPELTKWLPVLGGGVLALYGLRRGGLEGVVLALAGGALAYQGVANRGVSPFETDVTWNDLRGRVSTVVEPVVEVLDTVSVPSIKTGDLTNSLEHDFSEAFPEDQVLPEELEGVVQALVDSIGWSVLRAASKQATRTPTRPDVTTLITSPSFSNEWMSRDEIVNSIEDTSGLPIDMSEHALRSVEGFIQSGLQHNEALQVEHIGRIKEIVGGGLMIDLAEELRVAPTKQH